MITAKEAREIARKTNESLAQVAVKEVIPKIDENIKKNAGIGNTKTIWYANADYSKFIYSICEEVVKYGYSVSVDFDDERGHYLNICW